MIPILGINTASCGKKLLRISEDFSSQFIIAKFPQDELAVVYFTQKQVLLVFCFVSRYFLSLLADVPFT